MSKIVLEYELGAFNIKMNDTVIKTEQELEDAVEVFKKVIKNNGMTQNVGWQEIVKSLQDFEEVEINHDYKTVGYRSLKYFYNTGQVFCMLAGNMQLLVGGLDTFRHIMEIMTNETIEDEKDLVDLCVYVRDHHGTYSLSEQTLYIAYGAFSYGSVGYNFKTGKMDKGTNSEKVDFETFKKYIVSVMK